MNDRPQLELPVLLVDDEESILTGITNILNASGIQSILTCSDSRQVLSLVNSQEVDAVLLDLSMPHLSGEAVLKQLREAHPDIPVIIVTASDDLETAVKCMREGAFDYMVKAVEPSRLVSGVKRAVAMRRLSRQYSSLKQHLLGGGLSHPEHFERIVTVSERMRSLFRFVESIAPSAETILIAGETGTGKELVAEAVHLSSGRTGALIRVNSAGLDDTMFADALFGHSRGAFTGAESVRKGLILQAESGTLLLDEIGDLSAASQVKLLRLFEEHEFYALGSDLPQTTSARFVVATNRDLARLVADGQFRRDLYYRLQTHEIRLPPLRERREDLPALVDHFLEQAANDLNRARLRVPSELWTLLETYDFPGNVRELRSMVYNAVSLQKAKLLSLGPFREAMGRRVAVIQKGVSDGAASAFPDRLPTLKESTDALIQEALRRSKGNQTIAAGLLGISPQALSKRLARQRSSGAEQM